MNLCSDCKHSTPRYAGHAFCLHPNNLIISKVDGQQEIDRSCANARGASESCGGVARWYEAKNDAT